MPRYVVTEGEFLGKLASLRGSKDPLYLLFSSTREAGSGARWCPDCEASDPVIDEAFESAPAGAVLLEVQVERGRWKVDPGQGHPFRKEPFYVKGVPTILEWDAMQGKPKRRVVDCEQQELLTDLFSRLPVE